MDKPPLLAAVENPYELAEEDVVEEELLVELVELAAEDVEAEGLAEDEVEELEEELDDEDADRESVR